VEVLPPCGINKGRNIYVKDFKYCPKFKFVPLDRKELSSHWAKDHMDGYGQQSAANTTSSSTVTENSAPSPAESFSYLFLIHLYLSQLSH